MSFTLSPMKRLAALVALTASAGFFAAYRFHHAGQWQPRAPERIGAWTSDDSPINEGVLQILGNPHGYGRVYTNPFGERASLSVISAGPFENYHDPTVCGQGNGFRLTALKTFPLDAGKSAKNSEARAMIFRRGENERILFYYWGQRRGGRNETEARMGTYKDIIARLRTGFDAIVLGEQVCLVRVLSVIPPTDKTGAQTQRNVHEIARAVYHRLREDGGTKI